MDCKKLISALLLMSLAVSSFHALASPVSVSAARSTANSYIKSHTAATFGFLKAPATADIVLAHAEPSSKIPQAKDFYVFNIKGGGFIIVSGDDQAAPVLAFSDKGHIDMNNMSDPLADMLYCYKKDIEFLQSNGIENAESVSPRISESNEEVGPLLKNTWGPEEPYYTQCPMKSGLYSKVGCAAVSLAELMYFWKYPVYCDSLPGYWCSKLNTSIPALPSTTFDYDKMLLSYSHWDFDLGKVVLDTFTDEQVYEVAKLSRYCGQVLKLNYGPTGTNTTSVTKLQAMIKFGYNSKAKNLNRANYIDSQWEELLRVELNAGRPVLYAGYNGPTGIGHAFIVDGYNNEGYIHMNMGWYGVNDGWYLISAIAFVNRYGENRNYQYKNSMIVGLEPPLFCTINTEVTADGELFLLGDTFTPQAVDVNLSMSYRTLPFMFSLTDAQGNEVALSESITLNRLTFENGTDISLALALPENLSEGTYDLHLNYRTGDSEPLTQAVTAEGQLYVVGKFAKFGAPFGISDVIDAVDILMVDNSGRIGVDDLTSLIDFLLDE